MKKETSPANIALSENLQRLLKNENWTTVARKIGMNRSTLYNWTYGVAPSSLKSLVKLSDYFGVSLDELCLSAQKGNNHKDQGLQKAPLVFVIFLEDQPNPMSGG